MPQDLPDDLIGAAVIRLRAGLLRFNSRQAALFEGVEDLVIALAAKTVLLSDVSDIA